MIDIVICVDGSNSHTYKNSSVKNFCDSIRADEKIFKQGPKQTMGATGGDWLIIRNEVIGELDRIAAKYGEKSFFNGYQCTVGKRPDFRFIMAGHSRGGHILIHLAYMLKYRTYFMGLYDAVECTFNSGDSQKVVYNVDYVFHARRDSAIGSRQGSPLAEQIVVSALPIPLQLLVMLDNPLDYKNTGLRCGDAGVYQEKFFRTSHGGVGGEVLNNKLVGLPIADDTSCAITFFNQRSAQINKNTMCISEAIEADAWIRGNARKLGVGI